ncbi:MAG TPA: flavodoxin domain-containing protein [Anaerolineales bacterium]|nr:flavodoxin domain-containing protein [Anaerolineales bacterium]
MLSRILVTYASRLGSTAEVAEAIGRTLSEGGVQVDIIPMNDVKDLSPYEAVVAGSAIRGSKWLPEAAQFIQTHRSTLVQKRFAMFTVCITMAMKNAENYRSGVMGWVAPVRAMVKPLSEGLFAGRLDFSKMTFNKNTLMFHIAVAFGLFPRGDHRDWNSIRAWAESLKPILV